MKRLLLLPAFALFSTFLLRAQDNDKPKIEGSGKVITRNVTISSFDKIDLEGVYNVILKQGGKEELKIEADDNLQDLFEVKNEGSTLVVHMKKDSHFHSDNRLKVYVTFNKVNNMELAMVGNLSGENLNFGDLTIDNKSVGTIDLNMTAQNLHVDNKSVGSIKFGGKADNAVIKNKGVGSLQAGSFVVQSMDLDNSGVGSAEVNAEKELKVKDSFLGRVTNRGGAPVKRMNKVVI